MFVIHKQNLIYGNHHQFGAHINMDQPYSMDGIKVFGINITPSEIRELKPFDWIKYTEMSLPCNNIIPQRYHANEKQYTKQPRSYELNSSVIIFLLKCHCLSHCHCCLLNVKRVMPKRCIICFT